MAKVALTPQAGDSSFKLKHIEILIKKIRVLMGCCEPWRLWTLETMPQFKPSNPQLSIEKISFGIIHFKLQYTAVLSERDSPDWCVDINLNRDDGYLTIRNQRIEFLSYIIDTLLMIIDSLEMDLIGKGIGTGRPFSIQWYIGKHAEIEHKSAHATTGDTDID